jgi:tetratricopeptide (TPR) repeat protein
LDTAKKVDDNFLFWGLRVKFIVCMALILTTLAVYWPVKNFSFVNFDDGIYVYENYYVQKGITTNALKWAFSAENKNDTHWHPLTWLSHMLDCQLYGLNSGMHHLTSVLLHLANSLLLFLALHKMTAATGRSAIVAALFAVHPINVDSVAWIAQRKSVLSTFFGMASLWAYAHYCLRPTIFRYIQSLGLFALSLMAKPMLVTLPFIFLLIDCWPLKRLRLIRFHPGRQSLRIIYEKLPFMLLSFGLVYLSSSILSRAQNFVTVKTIPMTLRVSNALVSYVAYMGKMVWPKNLSVFYPFPASIPVWQITGAAVVLIFISYWAVKAYGRHPYLLVGWLWYLGALIPAIGLVQVGLWPAMADRFAYFPLIGLFIILSWGGLALLIRFGLKPTAAVVLAGGLLLIFMTAAHVQVGYWENTATLFRHALDVNEKNTVAYNNLGNALIDQGRYDQAASHYRRAVQLNPANKEAHSNLGIVLAHQNRTDEAIKRFKLALQLDSNYKEAYNNLGFALTKLDRWKEAVKHYEKALLIDSNFIAARKNLAAAFVHQGKIKAAFRQYEKILNIDPLDRQAAYSLRLLIANKASTSQNR